MNYSKLVITSTYTLERRTIELFQLDELVKRDIEIEYWDVGPITYKIQFETQVIDGIKIVKFETKEEFSKYVKQTACKCTLYLVYMNFAPKTYFCYRELSKHNLDIAYCVNGVMPPLPSSLITTVNLPRKILKNLFNSNTWLHFIFRAIKKLPLLKPLRFQFNTCKCAQVDYKINEKTKIIPFNSTDFNASKKELLDEINKPYYVFIDEYLPFHPDTLISGMRFMEADIYYQNMNRFFDRIESETGIDVIIAAHPIALKYKEYNYFKGRRVLFYKTASLIKHSIGVFNHCSTAMSLAIIFKKPIITLISDDMKVKVRSFYNECKYVGEYINSKIINIDHLPNNINFTSIDDYIYNNYKYDFLTNPESEKLSNADILYSVLMGCEK